MNSRHLALLFFWTWNWHLTHPLLKFDCNRESGCSNQLLNKQVRVNAWSFAQHVRIR